MKKTLFTLGVLLQMAGASQAATLFSTGFEYTSGAPTVGTNAANLDGADGQIGAWSGTIPNNLMSFSGGALLSDAHSDGAGAGSDWSFRGTLSSNLATGDFAGTTFSFDYAHRRGIQDNAKDNFVVGYDSGDSEIFRLQLSAASNTTGQEGRVGLVDGGTTWDLATTVGADADGDIPFSNSGTTANISIGFISDTQFTISLVSDSNTSGYTTIAYDLLGTPSDFAYFEFEGQGGTSDGFDRSGFWLDNVSVVPEPSSALLIGLGGFAFLLRRRR